jgi:hypothetical protein
MKRYVVSQFDGSIFQVIDQLEQREICVCANYDDWRDSEQRARKIAALLNENLKENPIS